jgi:PAS domain S-box-containing protein
MMAHHDDQLESPASGAGTALFRSLLEHTPIAMLAITPDRKVSYVSPYTWLLLGLNPSEAVADDPLRQSLSEEHRNSYDRAIQIGLHGENYEFDCPLLRHDGIELWLRCFVNPILSDDYDVIRIALVATDVTRMKRMQQAIDSRNEELNDITYMISHDLKGSITTIKGMVAMLEDDVEGGDAGIIKETARTASRHIHRAALRLDMLIRGVIDFAKASTTSSTPLAALELSSFLTEIAQEFSPAFEEIGGSLLIEMDEECLIEASQLDLYQVFANLISNALKYRHEARKLLVCVRVSAEKDRPSALGVTITDNGCGINADQIATIFRPFHRAHQGIIEGAGIGLACVKKLVEKMHGSVSVESTPEVGTTFHLLFRRA